MKGKKCYVYVRTYRSTSRQDNRERPSLKLNAEMGSRLYQLKSLHRVDPQARPENE